MSCRWVALATASVLLLVDVVLDGGGYPRGRSCRYCEGLLELKHHRRSRIAQCKRCLCRQGWHLLTNEGSRDQKPLWLLSKHGVVQSLGHNCRAHHFYGCSPNAHLASVSCSNRSVKSWVNELPPSPSQLERVPQPHLKGKRQSPSDQAQQQQPGWFLFLATGWNSPTAEIPGRNIVRRGMAIVEWLLTIKVCPRASLLIEC